jgi:putative transposase
LCVLPFPGPGSRSQKGDGRDADESIRFTEEQIRYAVQQAEAGIGVAELCRKYGVAQAMFYRWR